MDSSLGDWQFWTNGVGSRCEVYAPGQVPPIGGGAPSNLHVFLGHNAVDGVFGTAAGNMELDAAGDVFTNDDVGIGTNAPTEMLHVVGSPRFVDGNEGVGRAWVDDGAGNGVGMWAMPAIPPPEWVTIGEAASIVKGADFTPAIVGGVIVGGVEDVSVTVTCRTDADSGVAWMALSSRGKVPGFVTFYFVLDVNILNIHVTNDSETDVLVTAKYVNL